MFHRRPLSPDDHDDHDDRDSQHEPLGPLTHEGMPIHGWYGGEPIPDLDRIPQERWREVLKPLGRMTRQYARGHTQSDVVAAGILIGELMLDDADARDRAIRAPVPGMPQGAPLARGTGRQVNFRLGPGEYERLVKAAGIFAMPPTTLARVLTVRGVDRALHEHERSP